MSKMIHNKSGGTGVYSFRKAGRYRYAVQVSHMPEDGMSIRIAFFHNDEQNAGIVKVTEVEAELLWLALNEMAADLKWSKDE